MTNIIKAPGGSELLWVRCKCQEAVLWVSIISQQQGNGEKSVCIHDEAMKGGRVLRRLVCAYKKNPMKILDCDMRY